MRFIALEDDREYLGQPVDNDLDGTTLPSPTCGELYLTEHCSGRCFDRFTTREGSDLFGIFALELVHQANQLLLDSQIHFATSFEG